MPLRYLAKEEEMPQDVHCLLILFWSSYKTRCNSQFCFESSAFEEMMIFPSKSRAGAEDGNRVWNIAFLVRQAEVQGCAGENYPWDVKPGIHLFHLNSLV